MTEGVPFGLMQQLSNISKEKVPEFMQNMKLRE